MIASRWVARNTVYMHHNSVGLTIAIRFGGARPTDLNFGGGGGGGGVIAPPAPPLFRLPWGLMRQIHSCHSPPPKHTFMHVILCEILTLYLLAYFLWILYNVILLPHQVLSDDSPKPAGHHPHGNSFTVFTTGNGFQFRFFMGGGGSAHRRDSVSTDAFFNNILPNSYHKPYLINFYTDFCM